MTPEEFLHILTAKRKEWDTKILTTVKLDANTYTFKYANEYKETIKFSSMMYDKQSGKFFIEEEVNGGEFRWYLIEPSMSERRLNMKVTFYSKVSSKHLE